MITTSSHPYRTPSESPRGAELVTTDGKDLPLRGAIVRAEAGGGIARVVLEQTFENTSAETIRVVYKMPLPASGAVSGYEFTVGDRTIRGRVDAKERARERFEQAIAGGRTAALLEEQRADIFTQQIGNVPAGAIVVARVTIDQPLRWLACGEWEFRFPTVIGPRFVDNAKDAAEVGVGVAQRNAIAARVQIETRITDTILNDRKVESSSHPLSVREDGVVVLGEAGKLDRDIVLRWAAAGREVGLSLTHARPSREAANAHHAYGLLTVTPPAPEAKPEITARDLIVLLDTSGSMGGTPLDHAKRVIKSLVGSLGPADRLELVEFSDAPRPYTSAPVSATDAEKKKALAWLDRRQASGSTQMFAAVLAAMRALRDGAQRQVVLVTDGYIGGEEQIVQTLHERLPVGCRLHVVGVGAAPNGALAAALARAGRGTEVLVGLDEDVERPTRRLLERMVDPVLTDVEIVGDAVVEHAPAHLPDVFAGSPIVAALRLRPEGGEVIVRGKLARGTWEKCVRVPALSPGEGRPAIAALFAREHVADLETRWHIGSDVQEIDRIIERVGLVFQIATRRTSWIAIDTVASVDPSRGERRREQPQELPYGTMIESFGLDGARGDEDERTMVSADALRMPMAAQLSAPPASFGGLPPRAAGRGSPPAPSFGAAAPPPRIASPSVARLASLGEAARKQEVAANEGAASDAPTIPPPPPGMPSTGAYEPSYAPHDERDEATGSQAQLPVADLAPRDVKKRARWILLAIAVLFFLALAGYLLLRFFE